MEQAYLQMISSPPTGPHAPIGTDAPKKLVEEIQRRLDIVREIRYEPRLINEDNQCSCEANISRYKHIYRMKAIDALKTLEDDIVRACGGDESVRRPPGADLRVYLLNLRKGGYCPLQGIESKLINEFVEAYSNARSDPIPDFGAEELERYLSLLRRIQAAIISTASTTTTAAQQSSSRHPKETKVSPTKEYLPDLLAKLLKDVVILGLVLARLPLVTRVPSASAGESSAARRPAPPPARFRTPAFGAVGSSLSGL
ncbi:hypothetical protein TYRP_005728 [Tyrophagus putrescentiae]|nr:hypothetical protein TYRP_005728 [Tyrophagus putrescentiae]